MQEVVSRNQATQSEPTYKLKIEKDVDIPMRDGAMLKADVFRPDGDGHFPVLINMGIYQKDKLWIPPDDLEEKPNPYMNWETVNPEWWVPRGYICVRVDERGSGNSPGQSVLYSAQEAVDFYDAIEWAGHQPWSNGRVATIGISFFARTQWWVANLKPPSLKCIVPWEGAADQYRDILYHGGIFANGFICGWYTTHMAHHLLGRAYQSNPDTFQDNVLWRFMRHSLDSGAFKSQQAQWESIDLPMWAVGNWSGMGLHLRGATEGYTRAASKHKKLRIHCGTHFHPFYSEDGRRDQLRFFDYWLKDIDNGVMQEPPVKLAIRTGHGEYHFRHENEWPLARTEWTRLYLDLDAGALSSTKPAAAAARSYSATGASHAGHASASSSSHATGSGLGFSLMTPPLEENTEITGPLAAQLWVSSTTEDMDILLTLRNIDPDGNDVLEVGQQGQPVPVAKGWLRVSHRELDSKLSRPYRPYHKHLRRLWLEPDEVVQVQVEIWPTSMVFKKGHRIRLDIEPRDGIGSAPYTHYHADYNDGENTIYSGGDRESFLLLPIIPPATRP
ncbi:MAG TPA: CocE/NonD family hydrolase [Xanthobacteraceae bacterium]|nr:CocE/NonD family hydrolase [Xanthobacteraceae bacterium]